MAVNQPLVDTDPLRSVSQIPELSVAEAVQLAINSTQVLRYPYERRRDKRHLFPYPLRLTPRGPEGALMDELEVVVIGKSLTERGLDFYYTAPIPYRAAMVWLPCGLQNWLGLPVELTWCRSNGLGWYENGGQFVRTGVLSCRRSADY